MRSAASHMEEPAASGGRLPQLAVIGAYVGVGIVLTVIVALSSATDSRRVPYLTGPAWLDGWFQGDSGWYYLIADSGYFYTPGQQSSIAFFPTFPMAMRGLGAALGDYQLAGSILSALAGAASVLLFANWVWARLPRAGAITAIAVLLIYPYSLFLYGAVYSDGMLLLTALGAFLLLERRMYWLAGLVGALAVADRPVGVAVVIGLAVRMVEMQAEAVARTGTGTQIGSGPGTATRLEKTDWLTSPRPSLRQLWKALGDVRWRQAGVLVSAIGLAGWCAYLWLEFGDPLAFVAVEAAPGWDQGTGPSTWLKFTYLTTWLHGGRVGTALILTAQAVVCLFAVLLLRRVWRRFGWGYTAYCVVVLTIPILGTKDFMGVGRYVLAAFPVFAAAGEVLAGTQRRWARPLVLGLSSVGLIVATILFARGVEVS